MPRSSALYEHAMSNVHFRRTALPTVYFDMDGVLCDFVGGAAAWLRRDPDDVRARLAATDNLESALSHAPGGFVPWMNALPSTFWSELEPLPVGLALLEEMCRNDDISVRIATAPCDSNACHAGKRYWLARHTKLRASDALFVTEKWRLASHDALLIDDTAEQTTTFSLRGGTVILWPREGNKAFRAYSLEDACNAVRHTVAHL